jgi:hypothetical protein
MNCSYYRYGNIHNPKARGEVCKLGKFRWIPRVAPLRSVSILRTYCMLEDLLYVGRYLPYLAMDIQLDYNRILTSLLLLSYLPGSQFVHTCTCNDGTNLAPSMGPLVQTPQELP